MRDPRSPVETGRLGYVETVRLLAAGLVFVQHLAERFPWIPGFRAITGMGPGVMGVVLFFLVSGYVVPLSVRRGFDPLSFAVRRVFRVYPLLLAVIALLLVAGGSGVLAQWHWMATARPLHWIANLLLLADLTGVRSFLGVAWTLPVEFAWYGLFALAYARLGDGAGRALALALPLALLGLAVASLIGGQRIPLGRIAMLYACVLGYQAWLCERGVMSGRALAGQVALFLVITTGCNAVSFGLFHHARVSLPQVMLAWTVAPILFLALVSVARLRRARWLDRGLLPRLGTASYSLYLVHPLAIAAAEQYGRSDAARIALSIGLTGVLAALGYRLVELPGIAAGRRLLALRAPVAPASLRVMLRERGA